MKSALQKSIVMNLEAIAFQAGAPLFTELTAAFLPLVEKGKKGKVTEEDLKAVGIPEIIKKHTNLTFFLTVWKGEFNACVYPPQMNQNQIFVSDNFWFDNEDTHKLLARARNPIEGTIDLRKSWVTGAYAELEMKMCLGTELFGGVLEADEIAAITLHEVGHVMSYLEYLTEMATLNLFIQTIMRSITKKEPAIKRTEILKVVDDVLNISIADKEKLAESTSGEEYMLVIFEERAREVRSTTGNSLYDARGWEFASDQFATRHGAGKALATGLAKLFKYCGNPSTSTLRMFVASIIELLVLLVGALYISAITATLWAGPIFLIFFSFFANPLVGTYDADDYRLVRIKRSMMEQLKDRDLPKDLRETIEGQLKAVDEASKGIGDGLTYIQHLILWLKPGSNTAQKKIQREQLIEALATNDLFRSGSWFKSKL